MKDPATIEDVFDVLMEIRDELRRKRQDVELCGEPMDDVMEGMNLILAKARRLRGFLAAAKELTK